MKFKKSIALLLVWSSSLPLLACFAEDTIKNPAIDKVLSMVEKVVGNNNFIDQLNPDSNVALPFGIRKQIGAARYVIAIDSCKFKPAGAYFNAYAAIDFPGTTKKMAFEASNIKFNPKGVVGGAQARLMLVSEHTIRISNNLSLKLKNDGSNWVEWDCGGFKAINLKGYFIFKKAMLLPDTSQTKDSVVTASFQIYTTDIHNFITQVSITPFMVEGLQGWSFKVTNATVDMSELNNPPGMVFPNGYANPNLISPSMWTGFYLQAIKVKLPSEISKAGKHTEITANNLLIDNMGLTGFFQINNILTMDEGSMSGWDYSIDEIGVGFICNKLNSGHLKGKINIPVIDSSQSLSYTANLYYNPHNKETDYSFVIAPANNLKFDVFSAEVNLNSTSKITVVKSKGMFKPTAVLNGYMSFNHPKFNSNGGQLLFQDVTITTQSPYLTNGVFTLHTVGHQVETAHYPTSINDITFGVNMGAPLLSFGANINILDNVNSGFSAGTNITLQGKINARTVSYTDEVPATYTKTKWKFDKLVVNDISLGVHTAAFALNGTVNFRQDDPVYGDGFWGKISFSIEKVLPQPASVTGCFGAKTNFRYFYVDAVIPANIPLGTSPITLTKFMGGLYYHMTPRNADKSQLIAASQNQLATSTNALSYIPDENSALGLKAGVGFKYVTNAKITNGDVMLEIAFTNSGGLSLVKLMGDVYIMTQPTEQSKAPIKGSITIQYDVQNKIFDADADIKVDAYNSVTGTGSAKIHFEPGMWYMCVGKPSLPVKLNLANLVDANSYFMVGNHIEPALTPPSEITSVLGQSGLTGKRDDTQLENGSGFCVGANLSSKIDKEFGLDFFTVYGKYDFGLGFDMMMIDYGPNGYCSGNMNDKIGLNGYLANGDMYLYMQGGVGVKGEGHFPPGCKKCKSPFCFCDHFDLTIFNAGVAAIISGKLPKPLYFNGEFGCYYDILGFVKGNFNFNYEFGHDCTPIKN